MRQRRRNGRRSILRASALRQQHGRPDLSQCTSARRCRCLSHRPLDHFHQFNIKAQLALQPRRGLLCPMNACVAPRHGRAVLTLRFLFKRST